MVKNGGLGGSRFVLTGRIPPNPIPCKVSFCCAIGDLEIKMLSPKLTTEKHKGIMRLEGWFGGPSMDIISNN
jgi:hypothetical protein